MVGEYGPRAGFEPGMPGRKANTITTELKRILSNQLLGIAFDQEAAMLEGVVSLNTPLLKVIIY